MYTLERATLGKLEQITIRDEETGAYFSVLPSLGATLNHLALTNDKELVELLAGYENEAEWLKNEWYRGVKLSPFVNRITRGKYDWEGKSYTLPINMPSEGHAIHGLVYEKAFQEAYIGMEEEYGMIGLTYIYDGAIEGYPFAYKLNLYYQLSNNNFSCMTKVQNLGTSTMPYSDGWHPYFKLGGTVDNWVLQLPAVMTVDLQDNKIPTGNLIWEGKTPYINVLKDMELDQGFRFLLKERIWQTKLYNPVQQQQLIVWQDKSYPYVQIYTAPDRQSIAIEPCTSCADAFNNGKGLLEIPAGGRFMGRYGVSLV